MAGVHIERLVDPQLLALLGTAYMKHGKFIDGTRSFERVYELAPDSTPIRTQLAFSKLCSGNIPEALVNLATIRAEAPEYVLAAFGAAH